MTADRRDAPLYRVNRVGDPVIATPPREAPRKSSAAREKFKAARHARRHQAAAAMRAVAAATIKENDQ